MKRLVLIAVTIYMAGLTGCNDGVGVSTGGTFAVRVEGETFYVRIDNALLATKARRMMVGAEDDQIITASLARGDGGFNTGYGWHMIPSTVTFADMTTEVCDGRPSDVQSDIDYWVDTVKRYCPWGGHIVSEVGRTF
jgi:hypothetical protein